MKSFCVKYGCKKLSLAKYLKQETLSPYACDFLSTTYRKFIPASGQCSLTRKDCALTTVSV